MKTLNVKYLIVVILIFTSSIVYSQTDSGLTFRTNDISIYYSNGYNNSKTIETGGNIISVSYTESIDNISKLKFINDSMISIYGDNNSNTKLNIDKINSISIKSGSHLGKGIWIGALIGLGIGALTGTIIGSGLEPESGGVFSLKGLATAIGFGIGSGSGIIFGGLVGGIIGGKTASYEKYDMNKFKFDKKREMERILRIDRKTNGVKH